jgi:hypothetical protein
MPALLNRSLDEGSKHRYYLHNAQVPDQYQANYRRMSDDSRLPVIAGLAVGIVFVVLFSSLLPRNESTLSGGADTTPEEQIDDIRHLLPNYIDFSVSLPEQDIILKKGETVKIQS